MSPLELSLAVAALLVGLTGAWSPCGFSMVETIGLAGDRSRRWTTAAACAAFAPGAVVGGVATFVLLSAVGRVAHGAGGRAAYLVAAAIAIAAAVAEARGMRIVPQIRRQLPERWRWTMPMPLAAGLYGVLLGLGFTTFVLSFGVWALAGISLALGDPAIGLVVGAAFGLGRALPVVVVAPVVDRSAGIRCIEVMAERPALYRVFRLGDAVTLSLVAVALATGTATAARTETSSGYDPSAVGKALAFQRPSGSAVMRLRGHLKGLPGRDPAVGARFAAVIAGGDQVKILDRFTLNELGSFSAPDARALAVAKGWLAYVTLTDGHYVLRARRIAHPANPGKARRLAAASSPSAIGHPSVDGGRVFYPLSGRRMNSIRWRNIRSKKHGSLLRSHTAELLNPTVLGKRLLYVRASRARQSPQATKAPRLRQELMLKGLGRRGDGHRIYGHGAARLLWSTALSTRRAFVTLLGGGPKIVSVGR